MKQKGFTTAVIILLIVLVLGVGVGIFYLGRNTTQNSLSNNGSVKVDASPTGTYNKVPIASVIPEPSSINNLKTYSGLNGYFSVTYPQDWVLRETTIDNYASIAEAVKASGNHFTISSFTDQYKYGMVQPPSNELVLEIWVYDNIDQTFNTLTSSQSEGIKVENMTAIGGAIKKVWSTDKISSSRKQNLEIYFKQSNSSKGVRFYVVPSDTKYSKEVDEIVSRFKFLK